MKNTFVIYVTLVFTFGCAESKTYTPTDLRKFKYGQKATLVGVYAKEIFHKRAPIEGYYKIVVNDTMSVLLLQPYMKEALRSKKEVRRFFGKKVMVTGVVRDYSLMHDPEEDEEPPIFIAPCFESIEDIRLAEEESPKRK